MLTQRRVRRSARFIEDAVSESSVKTGMDVYLLEGDEPIGKVKSVSERDFVVDRRWRLDVPIPLDRILIIRNNRITLTAGSATD